jgi:HK97 family phage major capsid protein
MAYERIIAAVMEMPWAILPAKLEAIAEVLARREDGERYSPEQIDAVIGARRESHEPITIECFADGGMIMASGTPAPARRKMISVLPVYGIIAPKAAQFSDVSGGGGGCGIDQLTQRFRQAVANPDVSVIVMDFDSPGGSVYGVDELAAEIFAARDQKKIVAQVNPMCGSAAYYLASQCSEIACTPSGEVGSIGVLSAHTDISKAMEMRGVKKTYISAGKYKTEGNPDEPLSDEGRAYLTSRVNDYYSMFVSSVARGRAVKPADVRSGFGEGRMVSAAQAKKLGMIDRVASFDETLQRLGGRAVAPNPVGAQAESESITASSTLSVVPPAPVAGAASVAVCPSALDVPPQPNTAIAGNQEALMSTNTAAATVASKEALAQAELNAIQRCQQLNALATEHGMTAKLGKWLADGTTVQAAQAEILGEIRANVHPIATAAAERGSQVSYMQDAEDKIPGSLMMMKMARCVAVARKDGISLANAGRMLGSPKLAYGFEHGFSASTPQQGTTITDGGAAIPEVFSQDFIPFLRPLAVVRSFSPRSYPLVNGNLKLTKMTNGTVAGYIGEAQRIAVTKGQLGNLKLSVKKLGATLIISNDLLRFAGIAVDEQLRTDAAKGISQTEDTAFLRSAGTEWTPKGLLYQAAAANKIASGITKAQIAADTTVAGATLAAVQTDLGNLFLAIANANVPMDNMGIVMSKRTEYFFKFHVRDGLGRLVLGEEMARGTLFGVPYKSTTVIPNNLGANGYQSELYLTDFAQVVVADAPVISVQYSQEATVIDPDGTAHNLFQDDLTGIRFIEEHDMGVLYDAAIAVLTGVEYGA